MTTSTRRLADATPTTGSRSVLPLLVAAASMLTALLGACWAFGLVDGYPFAPVPPENDRLSALSFLPDGAGAGLIALLGAVGVPAALALRRTDWSPGVHRALVGVAAVEGLVLGVLGPDVVVVMLAGYLLVLGGIPAFGIMLLAGAARQRATRLLLLAVVAGLVVVQLATGVLDPAAFRDLGSEMATGPGKVGARPLYVLGVFGVGAGWIVLAVRALRAARQRCTGCGRPGAPWTRPERAARWGRWATIVAVLCPMPYGLLRMTWLLPTPVGMSAAELEAEPGLRVFGLGLGLVAIGAGVVTLGLIRPWGEVWPRWVPVLAGRAIPLKAVVVPGAIASALLLLGGQAMVFLVDDLSWETVTLMLIFPLAPWGAAVGLATAAYYFRRRGTCRRCGLG